jgi:Zinc carboxypeptidase
MSASLPRLLTRAEASSYQETSRHADVMRFIAELAAHGDPRLAVASFGTSPEGRDMLLLILSAQGVRTPEEVRRAGLPVVLVINGIHAGEVEGKEASLMLTRDMLTGPEGALLEQLTLLIVPLFNPDGNDRIDPTNRKLDLANFEGQLGPESGVGTRVNAAGINLNRDYMRQEALEMRLLQANVCQAWRPHLTVDCHATNGSVHRFAMTYDIPHTIASGRHEPILFMREQLLPPVTRRLKERTGLDSFYYGNFVADEGGQGEGWMTYTHHPRFGSNYRGLTNRLDLLLETYSYLSFAERVYTTYEFLRETLRFTAERGRDMVEVVEASQRPPERIAIRYRLEAFDAPVEILTREPRALEGQPISVTIPHLAKFVGTEVVERPWAYAVPERVAQHLRRHGLAVRQIDQDHSVAVEVARVEGVVGEGSRKILEAAASGERELLAEYQPETRKLPAGTYFVETEQPLGAIAVYLCEARSDDGIVACGVVPEPLVGEEWPVWRVPEQIVGVA